MSFVSVIMPTHFKPEYLELTLAGFALQTVDNFEVVLIDDGGSQAIRKVAEGYSTQFDIQLVQQAHGGRAAARNAGLKVARGDVIVFNDDDRIPAPGFLQAHLERLEHGDRVLSVGRKLEVLSIYRPELRIQTDERLALYGTQSRFCTGVVAHRTALFETAAPAGEFY